jgi:hypothetical protein
MPTAAPRALVGIVVLLALAPRGGAAPAPGRAEGRAQPAQAAALAGVFATYLGGDDRDRAYAVAVDPAGFVYVVGETRSGDLPVVGGVQRELAGASDAFVAKLTPDGQAIVFSSYLGGALRDYANAVAVGPDGDVYVTGPTASPDFPTANAYQPRPGGADGGIQDFFVARLDAAGDRLVYSTYLGGRDWEEPLGIALAPDGAAVVVGESSSPNFPQSGGLGLSRPCARQIVACPDVTVTKLAPDGRSLVFSASLGGDDTDIARGVALGADGRVAVTGYTHSRNFPVKAALQPKYGGGSCGSQRRDCDDAFVTVLAADGRSLEWSTYLGGGGDDLGYGLDVAADGTVVVAGSSASTDFPTHEAWQPALGGGTCQVVNDDVPCPDAFVAALAADGASLVFGTYLGGNRDDRAQGVTLDASGGVAVTGAAASRNFPLQDPWRARHGGAEHDGFLSLLEGRGTLVASTFLGGRDETVGEAVRAAPDGDLVVAGHSGPGYPVLAALQPEFAGGDTDGLVVRLRYRPEPTATPTALPASPTASATPEPPPGSPTPTATGRPPDRALYLPQVWR